MTTPDLKLQELEIQSEDPWKDDSLHRDQVAKSLTNLIEKETNPLVISLNGSWGTGKTFLLKRWQTQLELDNFKAIYFNAWEDDYCSDPLVAIIGQLWESLKDTKWKKASEAVKEAVKPILIKAAFNVVRSATCGIVDQGPEMLKSAADHAVDDYFSQGKKKKILRNRLTEMADKVFKDTGHPLVFIVDELDRCRPTFAIEMLERIKHIFDIPHLIFVFGVDRRQLRSSICSVYGDIDVDGYLRRFFDMEFSLPEANPEEFCKHLMDRHHLAEYFKQRSKQTNEDYGGFNYYYPMLCKYMGLSLRDIEHCIRVFILAAKNVPDNYMMFPDLLAVLLLLRLKNHDLYQEYIQGKCWASKVLNYIEGFFESKTLSEDDEYELNKLTARLYCTNMARYLSKGDVMLEQLQLLKQNKPLTVPDAISERTKKMGEEFFSNCIDTLSRTRTTKDNIRVETIPYIAKMIELVQK